MGRFSFFFCLFIILCSFQVVAIGVSPGRYDLNFQPDFEYDFSFKVRNNQNNEIVVGARLHRDLTEYCTLSPQEVSVPAHGLGEFIVHIELPHSIEDIEKPGRNILEIYFVEEAPGGKGISARTGVVPWVVVDVPFPERYAEITRFSVSSVNQGNDAPGSFSIKNRGNENLSDIDVKITLFDNQATLLETLNYNNIAIEVSEEYEVSFTLSTASLPAQDYYASINMSYGDRFGSQETTFRLGDLDGEITRYPRNITKQGIVPFDISVANHWDGDVFLSGQIAVPGAGTVETPRALTKPFKTSILKSYIDTAALQPGPHNFTATITIEDAESGESNTFSEVMNVLVIAPEQEKEKLSIAPTTIILVALVLLLLASTIIIVTMIVKKK
ncbi:hypothetical protein GF367_04485 [Candidatus Woesearchaeota archaeon]|nr:hypothetical protein [Candidatus Woesearchaeota archaeon]